MHLVLLHLSGNRRSSTMHCGCSGRTPQILANVDHTGIPCKLLHSIHTVYCRKQSEISAILNIVTIWETEISCKHKTAQNRRFPSELWPRECCIELFCLSAIDGQRSKTVKHFITECVMFEWEATEINALCHLTVWNLNQLRTKTCLLNLSEFCGI